MIDIDKTSDVEVLREIIRHLQRENEGLHRRLAEQTEKLAQLEGKDAISELKAELEGLKEQIASQKKKRFGRSSERRRRKKPKDKSGEKEKEKQKGHGHRSQPDLPEDTQEHTVPAEERGKCVCCGGQLEATEQTVDGSELITMVERSFKLVRHRRRVYRCRCKSESLVAKGPVKLMPTGRYSLELAIGVAVDKYWLSQPLARQVREMGLHGLVIDTQTLWDQLDVLAKHLEPSYELVQQYILSADMIGADETWCRMMEKDSSKRWWVWAMCTHDAVYYLVDPSRGMEAGKRLLEQYKGTVVCDAYKVYISLASSNEDLNLAFCWSHARRYFIEASIGHPTECTDALDQIDELFMIEREAPSPEGLEGQAKEEAIAKRAELRKKRSTPVLANFREWLAKQVALPTSKFAKAVKYVSNQWEGLKRFLSDPMIPLHNNHTEQILRNWVLGRKNYYGMRSKRGADVAAIFYTLIQTAVLCGVNPYKYLHQAATLAIEKPGTGLLPQQFAHLSR